MVPAPPGTVVSDQIIVALKRSGNRSRGLTVDGVSRLDGDRFAVKDTRTCDAHASVTARKEIHP
jgi:hypothetical protein